MYNIDKNSRPLDWPLPKVQEKKSAIATALDILEAMSLLLETLFWWYDKEPIITASHSMLYFILFGLLLGSCNITVCTLKVIRNTCLAGLWLGHLSYGIVFGTLFLNTWRVYRLLTSVCEDVIVKQPLSTPLSLVSLCSTLCLSHGDDGASYLCCGALE